MAADLSGKVVALTGGDDGIGRECALAYAAVFLLSNKARFITAAFCR
jgi:NAD(P)-dependent dehydrogenase (short-subunit alcohol dehydrogenase family)